MMNKKSCYLFLVVLIFSCKNDINSLSELKSNFYDLQTKTIRQGDTLSVQFASNEDKIDSVYLSINGKKIENNTQLDSVNSQLGSNDLAIKVYVDGNTIVGDTKIGVLNPIPEQPISFKVMHEYPHPTELFTEGLFFQNGKIYESAGHYGQSKLVNYTLGSTKYNQEVNQDKAIFSEGIALLNHKLYQLTYREKKVFVYDPVTFNLKQTLELPTMLREGWGMTTNGSELIVSDGSQYLFFFDENLELKRKIQVTGNISIYNQVNELEFIKGKIYANVWQTNYVLIINPKNGAVEGYYDLTPISETKGENDVLNGIAQKGENILVTGKNWSKIYEISSQ